MPALHLINDSAIANHYDTLDTIGLIGPTRAQGFLRPGYSPQESAVIDYFKSLCINLGLTVRFDAVGNFSAETTSSSGRFIEFGSHVDTVPDGGNFDGLAGVVAGFEAIQAQVLNGTELQHGLRLRIWRLEESSCYGVPCFGSSAAFGIANKNALNTVYGNVKLADALRDQGYDSSFITEGRPTMPQCELDSIIAHVELHIEQANSLELNEHDIGIITSIRGPKTVRFDIEGSFDHAGGTPYGLPYRRDANLAVADMQMELEKLLMRYMAQGHDIVHTVSVVNALRSVNDSDPRLYTSAPAKVCGFSYFLLNIRCADDLLKDEYCRAAHGIIQEVAEKRGVSVVSSMLSESSGIKDTDATVQSRLEEACRAASVSFQYMPSGAMHDAANLGRQQQSSGEAVPIGMVFSPCRKGRSHSPEEFASNEAIAKGARVLDQFITSISKENT